MELPEISIITAMLAAFIGLYMHIDRKFDKKYDELSERLETLRQDIRQEINKDLGRLALVFHDILHILKNKDMLGPDDIFEVFGNEYLRRYSGRLSNPGSYKERRKAELIGKARARIITYEEAKELQALLEEQKQRHESSGDVIGAILAFILLMALLWLVSELFGKKE